MLPTVSAIVINYDGADCIAACLESIFDQTHPFDEVIVVDNASQDNSPQLIRKDFPSVDLVASGTNLGYAGGCNIGINHSQSELVAILNNDIVLDREWLAQMGEHLDDCWSMWASCIVFASQPSTIDSAGDGMATVGSAYKIGHGDPSGEHRQERPVFGPCGAAALYRRSLLENLEGFDEDFFIIYEDADLNMRAQLRGFRCLYVPTARVRHRVNQSIGTFSRSYVYYGQRNSEILFWKNMPLSLLIRYLPERLLFDLLSFVYFSGKGRTGAFVKSKIDCLRMARKITKKRQEVQKSRRISTQELRNLLDRNWFRYRRKVLKKQ